MTSRAILLTRPRIGSSPIRSVLPLGVPMAMVAQAGGMEQSLDSAVTKSSTVLSGGAAE